MNNRRIYIQNHLAFLSILDPGEREEAKTLIHTSECLQMKDHLLITKVLLTNYASNFQVRLITVSKRQ